MRNPCIVFLLPSVGILVEAATRPFEARSHSNGPSTYERSSVDKSEKRAVSSAEGDGDDSSAVAVAPVEPEAPQNEGMRYSRPSVDIGYRYSSNDWLRNFITAPVSFTLKRIRFHLLTNVGISGLAIFLHSKYDDKVMIPMTGHSLLGSSLGLLLSYRTNSAYERFWEARGHWTDTKATCLNLAIIMKTHIEGHSPKATDKFLRQLAAYPGTLMFLCLGGAAKLPEYAQKHLLDRPIDFMEQPNLPAMLLIWEMQKTLHEAKLESRTAKWDLVEAAHLNAVANMVNQLMDHMSSCEKILRTPVPWTYSRHTSRFLTLWLGTLPYALVGNMKPWMVMAVVVAASYALLGIEEIGHLIEQPFLGDPLDGEEKLWSTIDEDGEASALIKRGRITQPYDIGIPVCSLAAQIRQEVKDLAAVESSHFHH